MWAIIAVAIRGVGPPLVVAVGGMISSRIVAVSGMMGSSIVTVTIGPVMAVVDVAPGVNGVAAAIGVAMVAHVSTRHVIQVRQALGWGGLRRAKTAAER